MRKAKKAQCSMVNPQWSMVNVQPPVVSPHPTGRPKTRHTIIATMLNLIDPRGTPRWASRHRVFVNGDCPVSPRASFDCNFHLIRTFFPSLI